MSHYKTLGVPENASQEEIKDAYRIKAQTLHPDKVGGDGKEMADLSKAYATLKDPIKRQLYDASGYEERMPIEAEVRDLLLLMFRSALSEDGNAVEKVKENIKIGQDLLAKDIADLNAREKKLTKRRDKITSTGPMNLAHMVIDESLKAVKAGLASCERQVQVGKLAMAEIENYNEEVPESFGFVFDHRRFANEPFQFNLDEILGPPPGKK